MRGIVQFMLILLRPIYSNISAYGHFAPVPESLNFSWEAYLDKVGNLT